MVFGHKGKVVSVRQLEHQQIYPRASWVEHNPMEIWEHTQHVIKATLEKKRVKPPRVPKKLSAEARAKAVETLHRNRLLSAEKEVISKKSGTLKQNKGKTISLKK